MPKYIEGSSLGPCTRNDKMRLLWVLMFSANIILKNNYLQNLINRHRYIKVIFLIDKLTLASCLVFLKGVKYMEKNTIRRGTHESKHLLGKRKGTSK